MSPESEAPSLRAAHWPLVFDAISDGIVVLSRKGLIIECNRAALEVFGVARGAVVETHYKNLWEPERPLPPALPDLASIHEPTSAEFAIGDAWYRLAADVISTAGTNGERVVVVLTDLTEIKRYQEELRRHATELELQNRRQTEFLEVLAHELRNPLAAIAAAADIGSAGAGQTPNDGPAIEPIEVIKRQAENLTAMVSDLLDVARIAEGKISLQRRLVDLREVVGAAAAAARQAADRAGHELTVRTGSVPMVAQVDRTRIEQLLANLLDNAIKYTPGRGRITIELDRDPQQPEGWLRLAVSDTGAGMPPDRLEDAFAMFVQYDQTLEHSQGGLGLGLSLVKRLAELHGGSISAQSDGLGRGTTMVLRLPRALPAAVAMATEAARAPRDDHAEDQSQRILLVEDNEDFRQLMAFRLRRAGFDVSQAANGIAGKRKALEDQPDAILIDLGLPEIDGYELARDVRAAQSPVAECTLIAMSGYGSQTARDATREAGFDAHLVKPVDFDRLIALLRD